ncbi:hypothetical protein FACS189419_08080 [Planctomycetales bacterium]|nr:hypothetical protein FACS189419_08080 [Planctomycetales bacterium]
MKALSIEWNYVDDILSGKKKKEYRDWKTNHRGKLLLHCKSIPGKAHGYIAGVCDVTDCKDWKGGYAFVLENVHRVVPIKLSGKQKIFNADIDENQLEYLDAPGTTVTDAEFEVFHRKFVNAMLEQDIQYGLTDKQFEEIFNIKFQDAD